MGHIEQKYLKVGINFVSLVCSCCIYGEQVLTISKVEKTEVGMVFTEGLYNKNFHMHFNLFLCPTCLSVG